MAAALEQDEITKSLERLGHILELPSPYDALTPAKFHPYGLAYEDRWSMIDDLIRDEAEQTERTRSDLRREARRLRSFAIPENRPLIEASEEQRRIAQALIESLIRDTPVEAIHTLDYTLEIRNREVLAGRNRNEPVFFFLIAVAGWSDALERENHQFGYHFHHVDTRRGYDRTNVLLTFDPNEPLGPKDSLYWEHHGSSTTADPTKWAKKRQVAVHTATRSSLQRPGKTAFMHPGADAQVLISR
jgi:hypothetical protein